MATTQTPLVSFVVPVRNDAQRLSRCLASIRAADYPPDCIDLIVADNGSTDGSDRVARAAGARVVSLPGRRVAEMRNVAVREARGSIVGFVDADHEIDRAWITSAVETLRTPNTVAAGAAYDTPADGTWVQLTYDRLRRRVPGVHAVEWLGSGNLAVWRDAFDATGGFDTTLHTCEDVALCQRLRATGARIMSDSRMRTTHFGDPATLGQLFTGELWRGRDNLRVSLRRPVSLRTVASLLVPMSELAAIAVAVAGLVVARAWLSTAGLAGLAALIAMQSVRMLQSRLPNDRPRVGQTVAVAAVYGIARAFALVIGAPHQLRHRGSV